MLLKENCSLLSYNTFGMNVPAEYLLELHHADMLHELTADKNLPRQRKILGGGSNILLTQPVKGLVLLNRLKGISVEKEDNDHVWIRVCAGEVWHDFVLYAISNGWGGVENLALIPGTVGASPIQNIGAYGVEARETIEQVTGWHWQEQMFVNYTNSECQFEYRDSIFKHVLKDKVIITSVLFRLDKNPVFNTSYGAIGQALEKMNVTDVTVKAIADAVVAIRTSKLPDPKKIGNAGSFFKNPLISAAHFELLITNYPHIPSYPVDDDYVKIPAGWLIEQCGWKGYRKGDAGVHEKQALVLVNYAHAQGDEIWALSEEILASVKGRFGVDLEREVQVW